MVGTISGRGSGLAEKGKLIGVISITSSEATTISVDVTTAGYTQVAGIYYADALKLNNAVSVNATDIGITWSTTASVIQITTAAVLTTQALQIFFIGE